MVNNLKIYSIFILFLCSVNPAHGAESSVIPYSGSLTYSAEMRENAPSISIKSSSGIPLYDLLLKPDFDAEHHAVVLNLVLHRLGDDENVPNFFDPTGRMHGYQKYIFAASDFSHGVQKSIFGEKRTLEIDQLGIEILVDVKAANVSSLPSDSIANEGYQFDRISLQIEIGNQKR